MSRAPVRETAVFEAPPAYSAFVVERFESPRHTGVPAGATRSGKAASRPRASEVAFHLRDAAGRVAAAGFTALGCPHLIAGADLVCERLPGLTLAQLAVFDGSFLDAALPLPPEKLDLRILLEDAVRDAARGD